MAADFTIKRNDLLPPFVAILKDSKGLAVQIPVGATARFHMKTQAGSTLKIDQAATIVDNNAGKIQYDWVSGDTDTSGTYLAEIELTVSSKQQTYPTASNLTISIVDDLA